MNMTTMWFDDRELRDWAAAWKLFPRESGKQLSKMINDMAFDMRDSFPSVIGKHYTIRNHNLINNIFIIEKAHPRSRMEDIKAVAGTSPKGRKNPYSVFPVLPRNTARPAKSTAL